VKIRAWHPGQLAIVWFLASVVEIFFLWFFDVFLQHHPRLPDAIGFLLLGVIVALPLWMLRVTWVWFGSSVKHE
jgi:hypothetical protein